MGGADGERRSALAGPPGGRTRSRRSAGNETARPARAGRRRSGRWTESSFPPGGSVRPPADWNPTMSDAHPKHAANLEVNEADDGLVVYDPAAGMVHHLNASAAVIF